MIKMKTILATLFIGFTLNFTAGQVDLLDLEDDLAQEVTLFQNTSLQLALRDQIMAKPRWRKLVNNKKLAISIVDLNDFKNVRYASLNGNYMMYAASMPKIAVLYAAFDAIEEGDLELTKKIKDDMWLMISKSNNAATTRMIDRVGFERIEKLMRNPDNPFYNDKNGGLWVGKRYAAQGKRNPEPLKGLSHAATTQAVAKFYYQLATGQLINEKRSKQMLKYLKDPSLHHKFVNTLDRIAPYATLFRKSGSWRNYHSDSIMVWDQSRGKYYILVAMVESAQGESIIRNLVRPIELAIDQSLILAPKPISVDGATITKGL